MNLYIIKGVSNYNTFKRDATKTRHPLTTRWAYKMEREILTYPIEEEQVKNEFSFFIEYFLLKGMHTCDVLFGYAWGNEYYPSNKWDYQEINLSELAKKVNEVETTGIGSLSNDDLFVKINDLEFRFCHDSDVHIYFSKSNEDVEFYYSRWKQLAYQPAEWLKNEEKGPGERMRFN